MSGEPKTLTPEEGTLAGLIATLGIHGYSLTFQEGRWWAVPPQDTPYEWCEGDTPGEAASKALGVPVVARDEAAELRAANHAFVAFMEGHHRVLAALLPSNVLGPLAHLWNQATALHDDNRRRLAGGENEK